MTRSLRLGCVALLLLVSGCTVLHLRGRRARAVVPVTPPDGYVMRDVSIRFVFDPARYDSVTADSSGARAPLAGIRIESVNVAGGFNGWSRSAWLMTREYRGSGARFTLEHKLADVGAGNEYAFRFLVNGRWWVEPSARTWNRQSATSTPGGYELLLKLE
jgi:hypothetical protein